MKTLPLLNSDLEVVVPDELYELCSQSHWRFTWSKKAMKAYVTGWRDGRTWTIQQFIWFKRFGQMSNRKLVVDHIDGNTLNNDLSNLRLIPSGTNVSRERKGVSYHKSQNGKNRWVAAVYKMEGGKRVTLWQKRFATEQEAIEARNAYKRELGML